MQLVASHIKNHVEPAEKYFEKNMGKRQKLASHKLYKQREQREQREQRAHSSVTEIVLAQYGDCRDNSEIVWSNYGGYRAYFHGCCVHLRVKSEKCLTASLEVSGLVWNTKINIGFTATAWIELFGDSEKLCLKQFEGTNEVMWSEDEVKLGVFAVKVAITGFK